MPKVERLNGSLLGLPELAERFGLSLTSVKNLFERNKLPIEAVRLGSRVLFRKADVDAFLKEESR